MLVWVQVPSSAPTIFSEKDIMPANGLTKPLAGIYLCKNQKYASVDIFCGKKDLNPHI